MIEQFKRLAEEEAQIMYKAPVLVAILIAGADNTIDNEEIREASEMAKLKQTKSYGPLKEFYQKVGTDFENQLRTHIKLLPQETEQRNARIISELKKLNTILPVLDNSFAVAFYNSLKDLARKIAEASGGVLGYMAVGQEESRFIGLNMIIDPSTY